QAPAGREARALRRRGTAEAPAHESASRARILSGGWKSAALAREIGEARDLPPGVAPGRPRYRGKSTIAPVLVQLFFDFAKRGDRTARRRTGRGEYGRSDPPLAHGLREQGIGQHGAARRLGWNDLRHH